VDAVAAWRGAPTAAAVAPPAALAAPLTTVVAALLAAAVDVPAEEATAATMARPTPETAALPAAPAVAA
jgi:hypothetical protein